jgi:hypothetical protein
VKHKSAIKLKLTDAEKAELSEITEQLWKEDQDVRIQCLSKWKRLKFLWNNIANTWYDSVAHDWRVFDGASPYGDGNDQSYYDQRVNVFRAYLESIIAALSVTVPPVKCYPDDAELSEDIETAKAGDKIAELIYRHNDVTLLWVHSLYVYMSEGFVAADIDADYNKEYGTYEVNEYDESIEPHDIISCPNCGFEIDNVVSPSIPEEPIIPKQASMEQEIPVEGMEQSLSQSEVPIEEMDMSGLDPMQQQGQPMVEQPTDICPSCNTLMTPVMSRQNEIKKIWVGTTDEPKGRIKLNSYGGLNIKIPLYARSQDEIFYLFYVYECHYAQAIQKYPDLHESLREKSSGTASRGYDNWEQWARLSTEYRTGSYPVDNVTVKTMWIKPDAYNILELARAKAWRKKYPNGISVTYVNDEFACAKESELDKRWKLTINPLADFIQNDPIGSLLVSIQEITNDLISLTKQTIEHGVGLTFVDPQFIDLNAYGQTEVLPGSLIPTKTLSGNKKLQDGIYEVKTATLSGEVMPFSAQIQSLGQLVSGALPSLYGEMNSETASQDSMSRNQAVQRLGNIWKMFGIWWKNVFGAAIPLYIELIQVDERNVKRRKDGSFINTIIRRAELSGKIGKVELEANENLPMTWSQRKDVVMQLLLSPNPQIIQMLLSPENLDVLREAIGINDFYVTGEDDRDKQYVEIQALLESQSIQTGEIDPLSGMPVEVPSIEVDEIMDSHIIQFEICRKWAVSEAGQLAKIENEAGYKNVLLHAKQHLMVLNMGSGEPADSEENGAEPQKKPNKLNNKEAPMNGMVQDAPVQ